MPRSTPVLELGLGAKSWAGVWLMERGAGSPPSVIAGDLGCCSPAGEGGSAWESPARESYPGTSETLVFCGSW